MTNPCKNLTDSGVRDLACIQSLASALGQPSRLAIGAMLRATSVQIEKGFDDNAAIFRQAISDNVNFKLNLKQAEVAFLKAQLDAIFRSQSYFANCEPINRAINLIRGFVFTVEKAINRDLVKQTALRTFVEADRILKAERANFLKNVAACLEGFGL